MSELGYTTTIVETYNAFSGKKLDFMNFADAIALNPSANRHKTLAIQITSRSCVSTRFRKMTDVAVLDKKTGNVVPNKIRDNVILWLQCQNGIWIIGWDTSSLKDKRCRVREVLLDEYGELTYTETKGG